jgi:hypothetical protein
MLALCALSSGCTVGAAAQWVDDRPAGESAGSTTTPASKKDDGAAITAEDSWTVLIYGSTEEHAGSPILASEFGETPKIDPRVKVVLVADHGLDGGAEVNPTFLRDSIARSFAERSSTHRALVMWSRPQDSSYVGVAPSAMAQAIREGLDAAHVGALDVIGFDSSAAARIEVAFEMKDLAKVFIANTAPSKSSSAWAYRGLLDSLAANPKASAFDFVSFETSAWSASTAGAERTHIAFDTSKLENLGRATKSLVDAFEMSPQAIVHTKAAKNEAEMTGSVDLADYGQFVTALSKKENMGVVTAAAENAIEHLDHAIIHDGSSSGASAIGVTFPQAQAMSSEWLSGYGTSAKTWQDVSRWNELLTTFALFHKNDGLGNP